MYNCVVKHIKSWKPLQKFLKLRDLYSEMTDLGKLNNNLIKRTKQTKTEKNKLFKEIKAVDSKASKKNKKLNKNKLEEKRNCRITNLIQIMG